MYSGPVPYAYIFRLGYDLWFNVVRWFLVVDRIIVVVGFVFDVVGSLRILRWFAPSCDQKKNITTF